MAYRSSKYGRKPRARRTTVRRKSTVKRKSYRKKAPTRRISRKRILNVSTRKKQDTMLSFYGDARESNPTAQGPIVIPASDGGSCIAWMPSVRLPAENPALAQPTVFDSSTRTSTEIYMRGLKERIEIQTDSSEPWRWRRIVFSFFGKDILQYAGIASSEMGRLDLLTSNGYARFNAKLSPSADVVVNSVHSQLNNKVFKGRLNIDYDNVMNAKTDSNEVKIWYDRTRMITSGNDSGVLKQYHLWHSFNSKFIYDDFEFGGETAGRGFSASNRNSMGDVYVVDYFEPLSATGNLRFWPNASLYWHER